MSTISRSAASAMGAEAVKIIRAGCYTAANGAVVPIAKALREAVAGTVSYPPDAPRPDVVPTGVRTRFGVTNETTLAAARRLIADGFDVAALNFASAKHPGGGFLGGARAQEESLCRSSGLFACIDGNAMYADHAPTRGGFYTDYAIYSPGVPVFRDDAGRLLAEPYRCAFVTSPAVNAGVFLKGRDGDRAAEVEAETRTRVATVLAVMAGHGHDAAVLGAWGCGVFRNDPEVIAGLFREALATRFAGVFRRVAFAVLDSTADGHVIGPFERRFGGN